MARMKRFALFVPTLAALLLSSLLIAQTPLTADKVGYLNARAVVEAHPQFARVKEVQVKAEAELKPLREQVQSLENKLRQGNATVQEQQAYLSAIQKLESAEQKWSEQQAGVLQPITAEIDKAIGRVAKEQGFAIVLDQEIAASSGLVVYAAQELDLTQAIKQAISK